MVHLERPWQTRMDQTCERPLCSTQEQARVQHFRGSKPIDGLWVSSDLEISNACVMPFAYGIGNHLAFILDIPIESLGRVRPGQDCPSSGEMPQQQATRMQPSVYQELGGEHTASPSSQATI
jgi:hypothetical protein